MGVQPTDIAFQMSFSHTGCPTSTDASDFGRGNTWHLNDGGIELDDERKSIFDNMSNQEVLSSVMYSMNQLLNGTKF